MILRTIPEWNNLRAPIMQAGSFTSLKESAVRITLSAPSIHPRIALLEQVRTEMS
jgi:hypothetical protein